MRQSREKFSCTLSSCITQVLQGLSEQISGYENTRACSVLFLSLHQHGISMNLQRFSFKAIWILLVWRLWMITQEQEVYNVGSWHSISTISHTPASLLCFTGTEKSRTGGGFTTQWGIFYWKHSQSVPHCPWSHLSERRGQSRHTWGGGLRPRLIEHYWLVSNELLTSECSTLAPEAVWETDDTLAVKVHMLVSVYISWSDALYHKVHGLK